MAQSRHTGRTCQLLNPIGLIASVLALSGVAGAESITLLASGGNGNVNDATAVSADGSVVFGKSTSDGVEFAWRWTRSGGVQVLPSLGGTNTAPFGTSAEGEVAVGWSSTTTIPSQPVMWSVAGQVGRLDLLPQHYWGCATGVSGDGTIVVGWSTAESSNSNTRAFRWTSSGGMQDLGTLPSDSVSILANGISSDGSAVVGSSIVYGGRSRAFRWTQSAGMTNLGALAGALDSEALDVNADGSVVVGGCSFNAGRQAFRWTPSGGMQQIGSLPFGLALSVSDDGYLVVGVYGNNARTAFLWHPAIGVVSLENYLQSRGVDLTGWSLDSVADLKVSGNGRFVVGGASFNGSAAAFIADIGVITPWESPCSSSDLFVDHQVNGADLGILLSQWGLAPAGTVSDINRDGLVNGADLGYLLNAWGPCPN